MAQAAGRASASQTQALPGKVNRDVRSSSCNTKTSAEKTHGRPDNNKPTLREWRPRWARGILPPFWRRPLSPGMVKRGTQIWVICVPFTVEPTG